jgi:protocatechuate 3,4-dioxygenase beta subunit
MCHTCILAAMRRFPTRPSVRTGICGLALVAVALAATTVVVRGQRPAARDAAALETRILQGQVRSDDDSAVMLRRARVSVLGGSAAPVFTDQEGRFAVVVPARSYTILITKPGFAPQQVQGSATDADPPPIQVRMPRGAAINGRVLDELGSPVADARVSLRTAGNPVRGTVPVTMFVTSDDRGEFRAGSLPGGAYRIAVESMPSFQTFVATPPPVTNPAPAGYPVRPGAVPGTSVAGRAAAAPPPPPVRDATAAAGGTPAKSAAAKEPEGAVIEVRGGEDVEVTISRNRAAADYRAAFSFVQEFEDATRTLVSFSGPLARGTATMSGRVTDPNGRAVVGAIVRLTPVSAGMLKITASDAGGFYRFSSLPAGAYRVSASKSGLLAAEHGQERLGQPGTIVTIRDRQRRDAVDVGLRNAAVLSGIVTDSDGEVMEGVAVHAWRLEYRGGRPATESVGRVRRTDDRGRYRIPGLQPGTYYVVASEEPSASDSVETVMRAPRAFHPGTPTLALATPVLVEAGADAAGIDVVYTPPRTVKVSGLAFNTQGGPVSRGVALVGSTRSGMPAVASQMAVMTGTRFEFPSVGPGEYAIQALHDWGEDLETPLPTEFTTQIITVAEEEVRGITLYTNPGSTVRGRVVQQGGGRPSITGNWLDIAVSDPDFEPASTFPRPWTTTINPDLTFQISGLTGPIRFTTTTDLTPRLWLKSADMSGQNIADEPAVINRRDEMNSYVDVVLAGDGGLVTGRVLNGRKEPVASFVVVAFPVARELRYNGSRYIRLAQPDERAQFTLPMLPPGEFWIAAVDALDARLLQEPAFLEDLSGLARRVTISRNATPTLELPLLRLRR